MAIGNTKKELENISIINSTDRSYSRSLSSKLDNSTLEPDRVISLLGEYDLVDQATARLQLLSETMRKGGRW